MRDFVKAFFKAVGFTFLYAFIMCLFEIILRGFVFLPNFFAYAVLIPVCVLVYRKFTAKYSGERFLEPAADISVKSAAVAVLFWLMCCYMLITIALFVVSLYADPQMAARDEQFETEAMVSPVLSVLCSCVFAPIVEELVFRQCVYNMLKQSVFWPVAMVTSGFLFGAMHGTLSHIVFGTLFGCILVLIYEHTGRHIGMTVVCHGIYNLIVTCSDASFYPFQSTVMSVVYIAALTVFIALASVKTNKMMNHYFTQKRMGNSL